MLKGNTQFMHIVQSYCVVKELYNSLEQVSRINIYVFCRVHEAAY